MLTQLSRLTLTWTFSHLLLWPVHLNFFCMLSKHSSSIVSLYCPRNYQSFSHFPFLAIVFFSVSASVPIVFFCSSLKRVTLFLWWLNSLSTRSFIVFRFSYCFRWYVLISCVDLHSLCIFYKHLCTNPKFVNFWYVKTILIVVTLMSRSCLAHCCSNSFVKEAIFFNTKLIYEKAPAWSFTEFSQ